MGEKKNVFPSRKRDSFPQYRGLCCFHCYCCYKRTLDGGSRVVVGVGNYDNAIGSAAVVLVFFRFLPVDGSPSLLRIRATPSRAVGRKLAHVHPYVLSASGVAYTYAR